MFQKLNKVFSVIAVSFLVQ